MSKSRITGWMLSVLMSVFLIFASASGKFTEWEGKAEMFDHLGWSPDVMVKIGIVEVLLAIMFLIPRTAFLGAVLLTAYLGGATATHVRVSEPFIVPIIIGIVIWISLGLRNQRIFELAFGIQASTHTKADL